MRQAGQARPRSNKLTSRKRASTDLTPEKVAHFKRELEATREALQAAVRDLGIAVETEARQRARSDELRAILDSTDVAILFLDADLHILFFTPAAKSLFDVTASDIGRPLVDLPRCLDDGDLLVDARAVLASCC